MFKLNKLNIKNFHNLLSKKFFSTVFKQDEFVIAYIRNLKYDENNVGQARLFKLNENKIFITKYFDIMHKHIINRNVKNCIFKINPSNDKKNEIRINIVRPSLYEYVARLPHRAVPSQYSILSFVPFLLEIDKNKKILESGTGSGCMTLFLSKYLDDNQGVLHTFDTKPTKYAESIFNDWKNSYNLYNTNNNKWFNNVEFFSSNIETHEFSNDFNEFYDIIYLDLSQPHNALKNIYKLLKINGILVVNVMHLTQILKCLKIIENEKFNLISEVILEPSSRTWEIERYKSYDKNIKLDDNFGFKCRIESYEDCREKRAGLFSSHWPGFLIKFRKV